MKNAWKRWDFSGSGLQTLNLELTRRLLRTRTAYSLWVGFPLGLHAFYLHKQGRGFAYIGASALLVGVMLALPWPYAAALGGLMLALALLDLVTLDAQLNTYNKALRIALSLRKDRAPPKGYQGRYTDQDSDLEGYLALKDQEQAGHSTKPHSPAPSQKGKSFQEQEAALRDFTARRNKLNNPRS